jgi:hypothetical protein
MAEGKPDDARPPQASLPDVSEAFSSNAVRLSAWEWAIAVAAIVATLLLVPRAVERVEPFRPSADYRHPYAYSEDYWLYARWSRYAASRYPVVVIGDSVVWGHYVELRGTLPHFLNGEAGSPLFANLGLDGTRPMALVGLIEYYARDVAGKGVILHLNPLWMTSPETDLQRPPTKLSTWERLAARGRGLVKREPASEEERPRINHPGLLAQVESRPYGYDPSLAEMVGVGLGRSVSYDAWLRHVRMVYFENLGLPAWTLENPYRNPLGAVTLKLPQPEDRPEGEPVPWFRSGVQKQDFPWVPLDQSYQWERFRKAVETLRARRNSVFVLIGPMNTHLMTEASARRYDSIRAGMAAWLSGRRIPHCAPPALPSGLYADSSHPLKAGYAQVARGLFANETFRDWLAEVTGNAAPAPSREPFAVQTKEKTNER